MIKFLLFLSLSTNANAGLPPTTSRASGDSTNKTTFNFQFPNFAASRSGTTTIFNTLGILGGGTGQTTANGAINSLLPSQTGNINFLLKTDGTNTSWIQSAFLNDSNWVSYTPTFQGFGTVTGIEIFQKRMGSDLLIRGKFFAGTATAVEAQMSLPSGLVAANATQIPSIQLIGIGTFSVVSPAIPSILVDAGNSYINFGLQSSSNAGLSKLNGSQFLANGQISFTARVPIQGWLTTSQQPVGSVSSNTTGSIKHETATLLNNGSSCTVSNNNLSSWISNGTLSSAGVCVWPIVFSNSPNCICSSVDTVGFSCNPNTISATSVTTKTTNSAGTAANSNVSISCDGLR